MCLPALAAVGAIAGVAGTAISAAGAQAAGRAAQQSAEYNAKILALRAADARDRGRQEAEQAQLRGRAFYGQQLASLGASGAATGSGTNLLALQQTSQFNELDRLVILNNAERQAYFLEVGAEFTIYEGRVARTVADIQTAGAVVQGIGSTASALSNINFGGNATTPGSPSDPLAAADVSSSTGSWSVLSPEFQTDYEFITGA